MLNKFKNVVTLIDFSESSKLSLQEVRQDGTEVITIGDAKEPRKIVDGIIEGFNTALHI